MPDKSRSRAVFKRLPTFSVSRLLGGIAVIAGGGLTAGGIVDAGHWSYVLPHFADPAIAALIGGGATGAGVGVKIIVDGESTRGTLQTEISNAVQKVCADLYNCCEEFRIGYGAIPSDPKTALDLHVDASRHWSTALPSLGRLMVVDSEREEMVALVSTLQRAFEDRLNKGTGRKRMLFLARDDGRGLTDVDGHFRSALDTLAGKVKASCS
jgi:hypothetical protein